MTPQDMLRSAHGFTHLGWANELRVDDRRPDTPVVAAEFAGTSVSSTGDGGKPVDAAAVRAENPCVRFLDRRRGYVRCAFTPAAWRADYVAVESVTRPGAPAVTAASFAVEAGRPGVHPA